MGGAGANPFPSSLPKPGQVVMGKYRIERTVGTGGMATVLAAKHVSNGSDVAIKFLDPDLLDDTDARARFAREASAMMSLTGKHIVRVFEVGALPDGLPFMVMELLIGHDLHQELLKRGPLPFAEACVYMDQACQAVAEAHAKGIIHRDIKPQNLFLTHINGWPVVRVLDFGIARLGGAVKAETITRMGDVVGTLQYMSPEQIRSSSSVDVRSDVWSLGACFYKLITGWPPFPQAGEAPLMSAILTGPPKAITSYRADVPAFLSSVIMRCLRKAPEERFPNANELKKAIEEVSDLLATDDLDAKTNIMSAADVPAAMRTTAEMPGKPPSVPRADEKPAAPSARPNGAFNKTVPMSTGLAAQAIAEHKARLAERQRASMAPPPRDSAPMLAARSQTPSGPVSIPTPSQPIPVAAPSRPSFPGAPAPMPQPMAMPGPPAQQQQRLPSQRSSSLSFLMIVVAVAIGVFVAGIALFFVLSRRH